MSWTLSSGPGTPVDALKSLGSRSWLHLRGYRLSGI